MKSSLIISILLFLLQFQTLQAQAPLLQINAIQSLNNQESEPEYRITYKISPKTDIPILATGMVCLGVGRYFQDRAFEYTESQIAALDLSNVSQFDQVSTRFWSPGVARASDGMMGIAILSPLLHLAGPKGRSQWRELAVMGIEAVLLNEGITGMAKGIVLRPRPYLFNPDAPLEKKLEKDARFSFWSGHSSWAACFSTFTAKVYRDYYRDSKWKPLVYTGAALVPITTAFLRVRAGKHYPTDVIVGLGAGAIVGWMVPWLHRWYEKVNVTVYPMGAGIKGLGMVWGF